MTFTARSQRAHGVRDATGQTAAAERHEDRVDVGQVLENLQRDGAVPGQRSGIAHGVDVDAVELRVMTGSDGAPPLRERLRDDACIECAQ